MRCADGRGVEVQRHGPVGARNDGELASRLYRLGAGCVGIHKRTLAETIVVSVDALENDRAVRGHRRIQQDAAHRNVVVIQERRHGIDDSVAVVVIVVHEEHVGSGESEAGGSAVIIRAVDVVRVKRAVANGHFERKRNLLHVSLRIVRRHLRRRQCRRGD